MKIAIVVSRFNEKITNNLLEGSLLQLEESGYARNDTEIFYVPGAFEIPGLVKQILNSAQKQYDAIVTLGCVIKGETAHFEYISSSVMNALSELSIHKNTKIPIILGVLTTYNLKQAKDRSDINKKNKGAEVMSAALESIENYKKIY